MGAQETSLLDVKSFESGKNFSIVVALKSVETKLSKNETEYLSIVIGDKNTSCICNIFGDSPTYNFFKVATPGCIILLEGVAKDYRGNFSPKLTAVRLLSPEEITQGNWLQKVTFSTNEGIDFLRNEFFSIVATISDTKLQHTILTVIDELGEDFFTRAAGISMHHAYKNGLLEHTVHSARSGMALLKLYPFINYDISIAGLLLHDVGKTLEYTDDLVAQKTKIGMLQGHLVLGYRLVRKAAIQNKLDDDIAERLEHILLSHHDKPEFGAVVRPSTPEAVFVALVDNLDAKMGMVEQLLRSTPSKNVFSERHPGLETKLLVLPIDQHPEDE